MDILWFFLLIISLIILGQVTQKSRFNKNLTLSEYAAKHPDKVKSGRVLCAVCGGSHIQFRGLAHVNDRRKLHYCVTCGELLYRSLH